MKDQRIVKIEERMLLLTRHVEELERMPTIKGPEDIERRSKGETEVGYQLYTLTELAKQAGDVFYRKVCKRLRALEMRLECLPLVPRIEVVKLAQNMLAQQPLVLVTDDTFNEEQGSPELTRIFLMEPTEAPCFDYHFASSVHENVRELKLNALEEAKDVSTLPTTLETVWSEFQTAIHGRFVVAFNLPLVQFQLAITARKFALPIPMLVGNCFLELLLQYTRLREAISYGTSDEDRLSLTNEDLRDLLQDEDIAPFSNVSRAAADQRALHLLHALQLMANGTLSLQEPIYIPRKKSLDPLID